MHSALLERSPSTPSYTSIWQLGRPTKGRHSTQVGLELTRSALYLRSQSSRSSSEEDAECPSHFVVGPIRSGFVQGRRSSPTKSKTLRHDSKLAQSVCLLLTEIDMIYIARSFFLSCFSPGLPTLNLPLRRPLSATRKCLAHTPTDRGRTTTYLENVIKDVLLLGNHLRRKSGRSWQMTRCP
jgi:hypothetical protein